MLAQTSINVMMVTLSVLSIERYVGTCHPLVAFKHKSSTKFRANRVILVSWILGFLFNLPESLTSGLVQNPYDPTSYYCDNVDTVPVYFVWLTTVLFFLIPAVLVSVMYVLIVLGLRKSAKEMKGVRSGRQKRRAPKMLCNN